jgi:uncharacterized C2H2 Zn-finger protein
MTRTIRFQEVTQQGTKNLPCPDCGKRVRRQKTFSQTINPFNKNANGAPKSHQEIRTELLEQVRTWAAEPVLCSACTEAALA